MSSPDGSSFSPDGVLQWIKSELAQERITGCTIEVAHRGCCVLNQSFGLQNSKGDKVTPNSRFWIASMTKPIVTVAALRLMECGKLSLQDSVSSFIPEFGNAGILTSKGAVEPVSKPPTVLDLLTHTAGLTYGQFGNDVIHQRYSQSGVFDYASTNEKMAERLARLPLLYPPGTTFEYGMSTDLLGRVIEVVTDHSLDTVLRNIVFEPLAMTSTNFVPDQERLVELAPSIIQETIAPDFNRSPSWLSGGAGLFSTASDYMLFARMLLGKGKLQDIEIIKPETFSLMTTPGLASNIRYGEYTESFGVCAPWKKNGLSFGLGLAVRTDEHKSIPGGVGEFFWPGVSGANFWVDPENELIVVFLTHAPLHRTDHRQQLREAIYGGIDI